MIGMDLNRQEVVNSKEELSWECMSVKCLEDICIHRNDIVHN
jgi:hypothetical protein